MSTSGKETVLHNFKGDPKDGALPEAGLTVVNGELYSTTLYGGSVGCKTGCGTVFKVSTSGKETVLYNFKGDPKDGAIPGADLTVLNGEFYSTTLYGGSGLGCTFGCGTVFKISP